MKIGSEIYLGLGGNLGDREKALRETLDYLEESGCMVQRCSAMYETPPWGVLDQPSFLNMAAEVAFEGDPGELLDLVLEAEKSLGRTRTKTWGPRIVDVDILAFGQLELRTQRLVIPHPYIAERAFVLVPWAEIAPDFVVPGCGMSVNELCEQLPESDVKEVKLFEKLE